MKYYSKWGLIFDGIDGVQIYFKIVEFVSPGDGDSPGKPVQLKPKSEKRKSPEATANRFVEIPVKCFSGIFN